MSDREDILEARDRLVDGLVEDLTRAGATIRFLALKLAKTQAERDRARDLACRLEAIANRYPNDCDPED